ncbi:MAG TPA: hypothetical protein VIV34_01340 [Pseudolabrys sp.]
MTDHAIKSRPLAGAAPDALVFDLVEWVAREPRTYAEVIDAWRTSCPRLTVWEDAVDRGLVKRETASGGGALVLVTASGRRYLRDWARNHR